MFAIISADGRQYRVAMGDIIRFNRMKAEPGDSFETSHVPVSYTHLTLPTKA